MNDAKRLFKKGDKITVTYEVFRDQQNTDYGPQTYVDAQVDGYSCSPSHRVLRRGILTPAPEPPYIPKPGEKFLFYPDQRETLRGCEPICVFVDDKGGILYDNKHTGTRQYAVFCHQWDLQRVP